MPIYLVGQEGTQGPPFNRLFFDTTLADIVGKDRPHKLTLFLTDGSMLDVCQFERLAETFMVVRSYQQDDDVCDTSVSIIPYGLVYRVRVAPKDAEDERVGFHWTQGAKKASKKK